MGKQTHFYLNNFFTFGAPQLPRRISNTSRRRTMIPQNQKYVYAATPCPREQFENANICIFPSFQETVGSHLKQSLPVVVMATLNQINSNHFGDFSKQQSTCKKITIHWYKYIISLNSILTNSIGRGLINLCMWSMGKLNKFNLKIV